MKCTIHTLLAAGAVTVLMTATQASALTLTNRDASMYNVSVTENDKTASIQVEPAQTLEGLCAEGCTIALENGATHEFDGSESVVIENGQISITE